MKSSNKYIEVPTIGEYLREDWLQPLGISQNALAKALQVPQNRINEIVNGKRGVSADTDFRLCQYFKLSEGFFIRMQTGFEQTLIKRKLKEQNIEIIPYANDNETDELMVM